MKIHRPNICIPILLAVSLLAGCATYTFEKGTGSYNQGYVVARYGRVFPEYTVGKNNTAPDEQLARERFKRRRKTVEEYYKKMGYIENRFRQMFIDPPVFMIQAVVGVLRMPAIALRDYKYNHDPKFREEVNKKEDAAYKAEKERLKELKGKLSAYIQEDLQKETPHPEQAKPEVSAATEKSTEAQAPAVKEPAKVEEKAVPAPLPKPEEKIETPPPAKVEEKVSAPQETKAEEKVIQPVEVKPQPVWKAPSAVIVAKPLKGNSPLRVQFYGSRSSSPNGRIVAYAWDFGDGDTSTLKNPVNTYWSTTYGARQFTATLTVTDVKGMSASTSVIIEVVTK